MDKILGCPIDSLRLAVFGENGLESIPFQVDKINDDKKYIFPGDDGSLRNTLESKDEIVFMGKDLRRKATDEDLAKFKDLVEISVVKFGKTGFAYLGQMPIKKSNTDYIRFDEKTQRIVTPCYTLAGHPNNPSFYSELSMGGVDHIDRVKLRASATLVFGKVTILRTEEDIRGKFAGVIDGPVRVLKRLKYSVRIVAGIHSPTLSRVTKSYLAVHDIPNNMNVPINMDYFFTSMESLAYFDFDPAIKGARLYCTKCARGFTINGKMEPFEFEDVGLGSRNFAVCSDYGNLLTAVRVEEKTNRLMIQTSGLFIDDQAKADPPEDVPGSYGCFGYKLMHLEKVPVGKYEFHLVLMFPETCPDTNNIPDAQLGYLGNYLIKVKPISIE